MIVGNSDAPRGFCEITCGRCQCTGAPRVALMVDPDVKRDGDCTCTDIPPNSEFTCEYQVSVLECLLS